MYENWYGLRTECFGYNRGGCSILTEPLCATCGKCAFYKTREQARKDAAKSYAVAMERGYYPYGSKYSPNDGGLV